MSGATVEHETENAVCSGVSAGAIMEASHTKSSRISGRISPAVEGVYLAIARDVLKRL